MKFKGIFGTALLALLLKLGQTVYAGEEKNKPFDEKGENPLITKNYEDSSSVQAAFETFLSSEKYHGVGAAGRALWKFRDSRLALDLSGAASLDRDLTGLAGGVEAYFGQYFKTADVTFYAQAGIELEFSQLETDVNKLTLNETTFSPKVKIGAYNKDFIADFMIKIGLGNYSLDSDVLKRDSSTSSVDVRSNFRAISDGDWHFEAGVHFFSKYMDRLWDYFVTEVGAGAVWQPKGQKFAVQFAPYLRYNGSDNGQEKTYLNGGFQCKGYFMINDYLMACGGIGGDSADGLQLWFALKIKDEPIRKCIRAEE